MKLLHYCKKISKETNIAFGFMVVAPPLHDLLINGSLNWRVVVFYVMVISLVYVAMIVIIKRNVWDKKNKTSCLKK